MKKSEAIKLISDKLNRVDSYFETQEEKNNFAQDILSSLEHSGMVPAVYFPYDCLHTMRESCPACNPNEYNMYNNWESENEQ